MATYEVYLSDPMGNRLAVIDQFTQLQWTRAVNATGYITLVFGSEQLDWRLFGLDRRVELWRVLDSGLSKLVRVYLLRYITRHTSEQGREQVWIGGPDVNDLLARRVVAAAAGSAEADKTGPADDMLKAIVREQLGASAAAARSISSYGFTVAADYGLGPSLSKAFSRRNMLVVLQDICKASRELGTPLYFDIVSPTTTTLQFRTFTERRGADKRDRRTPFSLSRGTLTNATIKRDWGEYANVVYGAGQGVGDDRIEVTVSDADGIALSPFNRCETLYDGRSNETTAALTAGANVILRDKRQVLGFEARLADVDGSRYQLDWDIGDWISAEYDTEIYDCEVAAVHGVLTEEEDYIEARLNYAG